MKINPTLNTPTGTFDITLTGEQDSLMHTATDLVTYTMPVAKVTIQNSCMISSIAITDTVEGQTLATHYQVGYQDETVLEWAYSQFLSETASNVNPVRLRESVNCPGIALRIALTLTTAIDKLGNLM